MKRHLRAVYRACSYASYLGLMTLDGFSMSYARTSPAPSPTEGKHLGKLSPTGRCPSSSRNGSNQGRILESPESQRNVGTSAQICYKTAGGHDEMKLDRITVDPARMNGQPCIRGMRLTVRRVVQLAAFYPDRDELRREYPELEDEDIRQALLYAATYLDDRVVDLPAGNETAA